MRIRAEDIIWIGFGSTSEGQNYRFEEPPKKEVKSSGPDSRYPSLGATFMRGQFSGQLRSVLKDELSNPGKVRDFIQAIKDEVIDSKKCTDKELAKLEQLFKKF